MLVKYGRFIMAFKISIIAVFALLTVTLIILKGLKVSSRGRGVAKMLTAALFVAAVIYGCVQHNGNYDFVLAIGLCFAFFGDLFLVFMNKHALFIAGVLSFSAASITIFCYAVLEYGFNWWMFIPAAILIITNVVCQATGVYSYGKSVVYLNIYTLFVTLCGSLGLTLLCSAATASAILFGLGCFMYLLSDLCLGLYLYKFHFRVIDMVNSLLYFPGMLLIALSLIF